MCYMFWRHNVHLSDNDVYTGFLIGMCYVCMHVCMYACMYVCMYEYICMYDVYTEFVIDTHDVLYVLAP
jgi:hypothetical protein